jgi:hypothetical protein
VEVFGLEGVGDFLGMVSFRGSSGMFGEFYLALL